MTRVAPLTIDGSFGLSAEVISLTQHTANALVTPPRDLACLRGHFPDWPVVPGILLIDLVDQIARLLPGVCGPIAELASVTFRAPLFPGQTLTLMLSVMSETGQVTADGSLGGQQLCRVLLCYAPNEGP